MAANGTKIHNKKFDKFAEALMVTESKARKEVRQRIEQQGSREDVVVDPDSDDEVAVWLKSIDTLRLIQTLTNYDLKNEIESIS